MLALKSLTLEELQSQLQQRGLERYRADQVVDWVYRKRVTNWQAMTNLPEALRWE